MEYLSPIIPLLRSFVSAEAASLKDLDNTNEVHEKIANKKLHFCSFDFSCTITPVDTAMESIDIVETCISKLHGIIQEAEKLSAKGFCDNNVRTIEAFVNALTRIENEDKALSYTQCSKVSICNSFRILSLNLSAFASLSISNSRIGYAFCMAEREISYSFNTIS